MIINFANLGGGGGGGSYTLPTATPTRLGGVKIGDGINVENDGTISVTGGTGTMGPTGPTGPQGEQGPTGPSATVDIATTATTGVVKIGSGVNIDSAGTITITSVNGVGFWKGTQAEYDALSGTTGYDSSTLYIITPSNN